MASDYFCRKPQQFLDVDGQELEVLPGHRVLGGSIEAAAVLTIDRVEEDVAAGSLSALPMSSDGTPTSEAGDIPRSSRLPTRRIGQTFLAATERIPMKHTLFF